MRKDPGPKPPSTLHGKKSGEINGVEPEKEFSGVISIGWGNKTHEDKGKPIKKPSNSAEMLQARMTGSDDYTAG